jgi:hypothetical protein
MGWDVTNCDLILHACAPATAPRLCLRAHMRLPVRPHVPHVPAGTMGMCCSIRCYSTPQTYQLGWSQPLANLSSSSFPPGARAMHTRRCSQLVPLQPTACWHLLHLPSPLSTCASQLRPEPPNQAPVAGAEPDTN